MTEENIEINNLEDLLKYSPKEIFSYINKLKQNNERNQISHSNEIKEIIREVNKEINF